MQTMAPSQDNHIEPASHGRASKIARIATDDVHGSHPATDNAKIVDATFAVSFEKTDIHPDDLALDIDALQADVVSVKLPKVVQSPTQ